MSRMCEGSQDAGRFVAVCDQTSEHQFQGLRVIDLRYGSGLARKCIDCPCSDGDGGIAARLERLVNGRMNGAVLPGFEVPIDQWPAALRQGLPMAEVQELLESQIGDSDA